MICSACKIVKGSYIINDHVELCEGCFKLEINFGTDNLELNTAQNYGVEYVTTLPIKIGSP